MKVNWDDDVPNIWEHKSHVPNHQPVQHRFFHVVHAICLIWSMCQWLLCFRWFCHWTRVLFANRSGLEYHGSRKSQLRSINCVRKSTCSHGFSSLGTTCCFWSRTEKTWRKATNHMCSLSRNTEKDRRGQISVLFLSFLAVLYYTFGGCYTVLVLSIFGLSIIYTYQKHITTSRCTWLQRPLNRRLDLLQDCTRVPF